MKAKNIRQGLSVLVLGLLLAIPGWTAAADKVALDPLVTEVIEMMKAGVDESVIAQWLESTGRRPADIGSQGVIALSAAGASKELLEILLELVEEQSGKAAEIELIAAPTPASGATAEAIIRLGAQRIWTEEEEPDRPRDESWDIYLYLDGDLVAWTRPTLQGEPVETRRVLASGRHEMRVVLQRYQARRSSCFYDSLSVPTLIGFEALPGDPIEIEVDWKRLWGLWRSSRHGGPLAYVIRQGQQILTEHGGVGGNPDGWQPICEDVQANFPHNEDVPKRFRNSMSRCVGWTELWSGVGRVTSRGEILAKLAADEFHPGWR